MYTPAGFDLTTHNSAGGDVTTRPRRQDDLKAISALATGDLVWLVYVDGSNVGSNPYRIRKIRENRHCDVTSSKKF
jgi:hypothetical protein